MVVEEEPGTVLPMPGGVVIVPVLSDAPGVDSVFGVSPDVVGDGWGFVVLSGAVVDDPPVDEMLPVVEGGDSVEPVGRVPVVPVVPDVTLVVSEPVTPEVVDIGGLPVVVDGGNSLIVVPDVPSDGG